MIMIKFSQGKKTTVINEEDIFVEGDAITHPVFKNGVIKEVNTDENQYLVHFTEADITKPISISFKGLTKQ